MSKSKIEWTDRVWNPVTGCTNISPGCDHCYAERMSKRFGETWGLPVDDPFKVMLHPERLERPIWWLKHNKVFVCSMADLFHDEVPFSFVAKVWDTFIKCAELGTCKAKQTFIVLTKRPERMRRFIEWYNGPYFDKSNKSCLPNVWLGVTAENQEQADKRIPILLQIPAAVRFVSVEPMLGPVNLKPWFPWDNHRKDLQGWKRNPDYKQGLHWVICGGESGPGARPMHPLWARSLSDQCQAANVPFFFKQWGEWYPIHGTGQAKETKIEEPQAAFRWIGYNGESYKSGCDPDALMIKIGKKKAGSLLDGKEWKQFPKVGA